MSDRETFAGVCEHGKPWATCRKCIEVSYCGCCGTATINGNWCKRCSDHVLKLGGAPWDRTWLAQTGRDCPYQV